MHQGNVVHRVVISHLIDKIVENVAGVFGLMIWWDMTSRSNDFVTWLTIFVRYS